MNTNKDNQRKEGTEEQKKGTEEDAKGRTILGRTMMIRPDDRLCFRPRQLRA